MPKSEQSYLIITGKPAGVAGEPGLLLVMLPVLDEEDADVAMARPRDTWTAYHDQLQVVNAHHERYCESLVADLAEFRQMYNLQSDGYKLLDDRSTKYQTDTEEYLKVMIAITQLRAIFVDPIPVLRIDPRKELFTASQSAGIALEVSLYAVIRATCLELVQGCLVSVVARAVYRALDSTSNTWRDRIRDSEVPVSRIPGSTNCPGR